MAFGWFVLFIFVALALFAWFNGGQQQSGSNGLDETSLPGFAAEDIQGRTFVHVCWDPRHGWQWSCWQFEGPYLHIRPHPDAAPVLTALYQLLPPGVLSFYIPRDGEFAFVRPCASYSRGYQVCWANRFHACLQGSGSGDYLLTAVTEAWRCHDSAQHTEEQELLLERLLVSASGESGDAS